MDNISNWTDRNMMKLNEKKSNIMVINFTTNYQFATRVKLNGSLLDTIHETKLLGTVFSSDMKWHKNSQLLTQKGYQRMSILRNLYQFDIPREDLVLIYNMYIRSILEFNSNVCQSVSDRRQLLAKHFAKNLQKLTNLETSFHLMQHTLSKETMKSTKLNLVILEDYRILQYLNCKNF